MKTILLTCVTVVFTTLISSAQSGWSFGANGAVPTGDTAEAAVLSVGADISYHFPVTPLLDLGLASGYGRFFGKEIESSFGTLQFEDYSYIPLTASANVNATKKLFAGLQAGYAIATVNDTRGGFLYRVKGGYSLTDMIAFYAFYQGINSDGAELNAVGAGLNFDIL